MGETHHRVTQSCTEDKFSIRIAIKLNKNSVELHVLCGAKKKSFVIVMTIGGKDIHIDFRLKNAVNEAMLFRDLSAPSIFGFALQGFGMSCPGHRMLYQFIQ